MARTNIGTADWFRLKRQDIKRHVKAVDALAFSARAFHTLDRHCALENADATITESLFSAAVVSYARPFGMSGKEKAFPKRVITKAAGCSKDLHEDIIMLRHKIVAHSDDDYADAVLVYNDIKVRVVEEDFELRFLDGATAMAQTIARLSPALTVALRDHVDAATRAALTFVQAEMSRFLHAALQFPDAFDSARTKPTRWHDTYTVTEEPMAFPNEPLDPGDWLKTPTFRMHSDGYLWRSISITAHLPPRKIKFETPSGEKVAFMTGPEEQVREEAKRQREAWASEAVPVTNAAARHRGEGGES
jgi:hypothetical protein